MKELISLKVPGIFIFDGRCSHCGERVTISFGYKRSTYEPEFTVYKYINTIGYKYIDKGNSLEANLKNEPEIHTCCGKGKDCDCLK